MFIPECEISVLSDIVGYIMLDPSEPPIIQL